MYRSNEVSLRMEFEKRRSHVASKGGVNWSWSQEKMKKVKRAENSK